MPEQNQRPYPRRRRRRRRRRRLNYTAIIFWLAVLLGILCIVLGVLRASRGSSGGETTVPTTNTTQSTQATQATEPTGPANPTDEPTTEPPVTKTGSATIAATGDILMHLPCIQPGLNSATGEYNFAHYFSYVKDYISRADYAVANLETTLCGDDNGYPYYGYPSFNCPDGIVPSLQNAGFDMLLTANNHSYDTKTVGFHRTQQTIAGFGMDYTGTVTNAENNNYLVKDINGIRIGMICYTYETDQTTDGVALNGIPLTASDAALINTFSESDLDTFYANMAEDIAAMETDGAEAIVLYIHWGSEYQLSPSATQTAIAQKMCDLGVDVIVGGHPHVIQPMELLTGTDNPEHKTVCFYSTGNALSNQRREYMNLNTGHTEDGVLFTFSFAKYSDGTVRVEDVEYLPLWINLHTSDATGKQVYDILPLDTEIEDWKTQFDLTSGQMALAEDSYERTTALLSDGLDEVQAYLETLPTP